MKRLILDASVAIKGFLKEEMTAKAEQIIFDIRQSKIEAIVPHYFYFEIGNICLKRYRRKEISVKDTAEIYNVISSLPLTQYDDLELADVSFENAIFYDISTYDSAYLSLAQMYIAPLVTADKRLYNTVKDRFEFIEYLDDFC